MGLTAALRSLAARRPHLFVLQAGDGLAARLAVEDAAAEHDWPLADALAEADALLVCGQAGPPWAEPVARAATQLGRPGRVLRLARAPASRAELAASVRRTLAAPPPARQPATHDGVPLPGYGPDRDGLALDHLTIGLGPVLAHWPAGLVLHTVQQGDVLESAEVESAEVMSTGGGAAGGWAAPWVGPARSVGSLERHRMASHLDSLARLLAVAGWDQEAAQARRLRAVAAGGVATVPGLERWTDRIRRAEGLRRMTQGLGVLTPAAVRRHGITGPAARASGVAVDARVQEAAYPGWVPLVASDDGDVWARTLQWLAAIDDASRLRGDATPVQHSAEGPRGRLPGASAALLAALPALVDGCELGGARLVVASLDPDLDEPAPGAARG